MHFLEGDVLEEKFMNGTLLADFFKLKSHVQNFRREDVDDLIITLFSEGKSLLERFWKTAAESLRDLAPQLTLLELSPSDELLRKRFKMVAIQYICDYIEYFNLKDEEWHFKLRPVLEYTLANLQVEFVSKEKLFLSIKDFLVLIIQDIFEK